jgi:hypothetical protein
MPIYSLGLKLNIISSYYLLRITSTDVIRVLNTAYVDPQFLLQHLLFYNLNYFRLLDCLLNRLYGLRNVIYHSWQHLNRLPTPKISNLLIFLAYHGTIFVVPISRPTATFSFPLSIYLVQTTCFVNLRSIFLYLYNELSKTAFLKRPYNL